MPNAKTTKAARKLHTAKPVKPAAPAIAAKPAVIVKPVATATAAAPSVKPATTVAPADATAEPRKPAANITRTVSTVAAMRTNFGELSDRDQAYFAFYKRIATSNGGKLSVAAIVETGNRPAYAGSNKPHDAGVIVRLIKAGLFSGNGESFALTSTGESRKA